jgi:hypothetical protein
MMKAVSAIKIYITIFYIITQYSLIKDTYGLKNTASTFRVELQRFITKRPLREKAKLL